MKPEARGHRHHCTESRLSTEISSSTDSQWIPIPPPIKRHLRRCSAVALSNRGNHANGEETSRPSASTTRSIVSVNATSTASGSNFMALFHMNVRWLLAFQAEKEKAVTLYSKHGRHPLPPSSLAKEVITADTVGPQARLRRRIPVSLIEITPPSGEMHVFFTGKTRGQRQGARGREERELMAYSVWHERRVESSGREKCTYSKWEGKRPGAGAVRRKG